MMTIKIPAIFSKHLASNICMSRTVIQKKYLETLCFERSIYDKAKLICPMCEERESNNVTGNMTVEPTWKKVFAFSTNKYSGYVVSLEEAMALCKRIRVENHD